MDLQKNQIIKQNQEEMKKSLSYIFTENQKEIKTFRKTAISTDGNHKVNSSGEHQNRYILPDGRVIEVMTDFGWIYKAFIFANEKVWKEYNPKMPYAVYYEL